MNIFLRIFILAIIMLLNSGSLIAVEQDELTLPEAVSRALMNSTALISLKTKGDLSKRLISERWRDFLPDLSFRYQKEDAVAYREEDYRNQSAMIEIGYDISTGGKTYIEYKISRIERLLAQEEYRIERNNIILNVKRTCYELIRNRDEIAINRKLLDSLFIQKRIIDEEKRLGMATELQRVRVEARISEAEYGILHAENEYKNRLKDFKVLIGFPPGRNISIKKPDMRVENLPRIMQSRDRLISIALKNRSEFKRSRYAIYKTRKEMQLARYYYLPKFRLTGSCGYTGDRYPPNKKTWSIGFSVTTALFGSSVSGSQSFGESDNGNRRSSSSSSRLGVYDDPSYLRKIIGSESSFREAKLEYNKLKKSIVIEVARAFDNLVENKKLVRVAEKNEAMLEKQAEIENTRARLGEITRYDVLKTYLELAESRLRLLKAKTDYRIALAVLERAVGHDIGGLRLNGALKN